jgi:hypothetical protein
MQDDLTVRGLFLGPAAAFLVEAIKAKGWLRVVYGGLTSIFF